ncbi:thiol peroxidase [Mesonia maritima]|uniref:Thiol peroxidase n=1 Tax=Mesonia maritima TaxID=1793873 RepID=A0ABU1K6C7_9FLAO|nr:thiol peroxidase [Mesonia maritima]MDR6301149.1 thiol peroxidase [Mesonia maritima]
MATIKMNGEAIQTSGELPKKGEKAPDFRLIDTNLKSVKLSDFKGKRIILNIFPSIDTGVCATSVKNFNTKANDLQNTVVVCISRDLPFAQKRFMDHEKIANLICLSDYRHHSFGKDYELEISEGIFEALLSRVVIVIDENQKIIYTEQVEDISHEPNYLAALKTLL